MKAKPNNSPFPLIGRASPRMESMAGVILYDGPGVPTANPGIRIAVGTPGPVQVIPMII